MTAAHTPTPWRTDSAECSTDAMTYIYGADGSDFAHVPTEDGDRIVLCVNAHDALVAALRDIEGRSDASMMRAVARAALAKVFA